MDGRTDGDNSKEIMDIEMYSNKHIDVTKQINNRMNYERKLAKAKGETATHVHFVGDSINLKEKYTSKLPSTVPFTCTNESNLQTLGEFLFDPGLLKLLPTKGVTEIKRNAFRLMTIFNPKEDVLDSNVLESENSFYKFIEKCRDKCPVLEETEGNPYDTTTVFSSLGLLWNIKQYEINQFDVPISADGTDHTMSNNYQLLHFGIFNRNKCFFG